MNPDPFPEMAPPRPARSVAVTVIGWLAIVGGAILTPISVISCLMVLAPHNGDFSGTLMGWLTVVVAPPASLVAGIGLLRRQRWARFYLLLLCGMILVANCIGIVRGPTPTTQYTSATGVTTTVMGSESHASLIAMSLSALGIIVLLTPKVGAEFQSTLSAPSNPRGMDLIPAGNEQPRSERPISRGTEGMSPASTSAPPPLDRAGAPDPRATGGPVGGPARDTGEALWRVGHRGRDQMYYEEFLNGSWQRIEIDGEMLMGRAHHVIHFATVERWQGYPDWARHRRDEIIARLKSKFHPPDYEYSGDVAAGSVGVSPHRGPNPAIGSLRSPPQPIAPIPPARDLRPGLVLLLTTAALLVVTGAMVWQVGNGLDRGEISLPTKFSSHARTVSRQADPALFFVSVGIYSVLGLGTLGLAVWGLKETFQPRR